MLGTRNVIDLCMERSTKLVFASSSEIYGELDHDPLVEDHDQLPLRPANDYAISKWANELQIVNSEKDGLECVRCRFFNAYGPGETYHPYRSVVALFCSHALIGLPWTVYDGYSRVFMYVDDFIPTLARVADRFTAGEVYNIGGTDFRSVRELSDLVLEHTGADPGLVTYMPEDLHNVKSKRPDISKAAADLDHDPVDPAGGRRAALHRLAAGPGHGGRQSRRASRPDQGLSRPARWPRMTAARSPRRTRQVLARGERDPGRRGVRRLPSPGDRRRGPLSHPPGLRRADRGQRLGARGRPLGHPPRRLADDAVHRQRLRHVPARRRARRRPRLGERVRDPPRRPARARLLRQPDRRAAVARDLRSDRRAGRLSGRRRGRGALRACADARSAGRRPGGSPRGSRAGAFSSGSA